MNKYYDCVIVGAGPTGIYACYELMLKRPDLKVLLVDKGHDIMNRNCPILNKKIKKCPKDASGHSGCHPSCSMTSGFGGCGAYSDGKFNITDEFGGWMNQYIEDEEVLELIKYVDNINLLHGAPKELTDPTTKEVYENIPNYTNIKIKPNDFVRMYISNQGLKKYIGQTFGSRTEYLCQIEDKGGDK